MQASRLAPVQTASMNTKRMKGGIAQASSKPMMMVSAMFTGPVNRCSRIQATGPTTLGGGGKEVASVALMVRSSPFDQRLAAVVDVHQEGRREADGQVDQHGDADDFDCLPGLVQHGAGEHVGEVRIADEDGQRRVLGQV